MHIIKKKNGKKNVLHPVEKMIMSEKTKFYYFLCQKVKVNLPYVCR